MKWIVKLTDVEVATIRVVSTLRSLGCVLTGTKDAKMGDLDGLDITHDGFMAEYAFSKSRNVFMGIDASPRSGSYDLVYIGKRIDVKATRNPKGNLLATLKVNPDVDVFTLAVIDGNSVEFVGYCLAKDLYKPENIKNLGHGDTYVMLRENLTPFKEL